MVHIGSNNTEFDNTIDSKLLSKSDCERDLGIYIQKDLKWDTQVRNATAKANRMLGIIRKAFKYPCSETIKLLYCSMVRPHLEYAVSSWCPYLEKDVNELEKVQRRATKLIPELHDLDYKERLNSLQLTDLSTRRLRGDLIQMYKVANNYEYIEFNKGINYSLNTRSESKRYELRRNCSCLTREQVRNCLP